MRMDLETLARIVEERLPTARTTCVPEANQIVVTFTNRPDVEMVLLTPWLQKEIKQGAIESDELFELLQSVHQIASHSMIRTTLKNGIVLNG